MSSMPAAADQNIYCPACSYDLRGLEPGRCPECGFDFANALNLGSRIPWVHRDKFGWLRSFLATVWFVTRRPKALAQEAVRPVPYVSAQRFRMMLVVVLYLVLWLVDLAHYLGQWPSVLGALPTIGTTIFIIIHVGVILWLIAVTGVHTYFFHPRHIPIELQNRAIALAYYATAPLAWFMLPALAGLGVAMLWKAGGLSAAAAENLGAALWIAGALLPIGVFVSQLHLVARGVLRSTASTMKLLFLWPLTLLGVTVLTLGVVPAIGIYFALLIYTVFWI